jgi:hypothetical protein
MGHKKCRATEQQWTGQWADARRYCPLSWNCSEKGNSRMMTRPGVVIVKDDKRFGVLSGGSEKSGWWTWLNLIVRIV